MIHRLDDDWNTTDAGEYACYTQSPEMIPTGQAPRVIYELRLDIDRLNAEVMALP